MERRNIVSCWLCPLLPSESQHPGDFPGCFREVPGETHLPVLQEELQSFPFPNSTQHKSPKNVIFREEHRSFLQTPALPPLHNASLNQQVLDIIGSQYIAEVCSATAVQINIFTTAVSCGAYKIKMHSSPMKKHGRACTLAGDFYYNGIWNQASFFTADLLLFFFKKKKKNKTKAGWCRCDGGAARRKVGTQYCWVGICPLWMMTGSRYWSMWDKCGCCIPRPWCQQFIARSHL